MIFILVLVNTFLRIRDFFIDIIDKLKKMWF